MCESVTQVLWRNSGSRVCGRIDVDVVVTHVVREAMEHHGLVEDLIKCFSELLLVHTDSLH